jgi:hypothetical protein
VQYIYNSGIIRRTIIIWLAFQLLMWIVFGVSYLIHIDAWTNVSRVEPSSAAVGGWSTTFIFILFNNAIICLLIVVGNIFVRFASVTPGVIALLIQAVSIGWLAGANGFEVPFQNVMTANMQFLKIGLWETTSYTLACAITLPKSLYIADTFPAKEWSEVRKFKDIRLTVQEFIVTLLGGLMLIGAAIVETIALTTK